MTFSNTDKDWQQLGEKNPYQAVLGSDKYNQSALDEQALADFFVSGEAHVARVFDVIHERLGVVTPPRRALDFGCGVGRVVIPLAARCAHVTGVDISDQMLAEARQNAAQRGVANVDFCLSDEELSCLSGEYDLIHSYIVFQHIPTKRGMAILKQLIIAHLANDGVGVIHLVYRRKTSRLLGLAWDACQASPLVRGLANVLVLKRPFSYPMMQMNTYNLQQVFGLLHDNGCHDIAVRYSDHAAPYMPDRLTHHGVLIFFRKGETPIWDEL